MRRRAIHEVALTSKSLAKVSDFAERLFWRLILVANNKGEFASDPQLIVARCFPMMLEKVNAEQVRTAMNELRDAGSIKRLNGTGVFVNWNKYQPQRTARERRAAEAPGAVVTFDLGSGFVIDERLIEVWSRAYPGVNLSAEIAKAHAYAASNWQKCHGYDWRSYLNRWLRRTYNDLQQKHRTMTIGKSQSATPDEIEAARRMAEEVDQVVGEWGMDPETAEEFLGDSVGE